MRDPSKPVTHPIEEFVRSLHLAFDSPFGQEHRYQIEYQIEFWRSIWKERESLRAWISAGKWGKTDKPYLESRFFFLKGIETEWEKKKRWEGSQAQKARKREAQAREHPSPARKVEEKGDFADFQAEVKKAKEELARVEGYDLRKMKE